MKAKGEALSQSEIEALLASLPGDGGAPPPMSVFQSTKKQVRTWDFRKPDKFSKDHLRSLLALHQNFARIASNAVTARLRTSATIKVTSVDQGLYEEYIELLPAQSIINVVSMKPLEGNIAFEFQPALAMVMIDRLLGGRGSGGDPKHELTDIELALLRNLVRTLLDAMREAWLNLHEVDPTIEDIASSPTLVQVAAPSDIVVIVLLEVQIGQQLGTISLCIPHLVLEPLMHRLSAQVWVASSRRHHTTPETRARIEANLKRASVNISAELGRTNLTVDELAQLRAGDVLLLDPGSVRTARLKVVDQYKFKGVPGLVGGRLAVQVTELEGDHDVAD
jgi:flagellar motor switch protein FliM